LQACCSMPSSISLIRSLPGFRSRFRSKLWLDPSDKGGCAVLLPLAGRRLYYDLVGPEDGPTVCVTHSLASDSGMWAEQMPPLVHAGFRILRLDMRGHGGSDPVAGDYTMAALAGDVAVALDMLGIARVHYLGLSIGGMIGQAFAIAHGDKLISAMWCDTLPANPKDAADQWAQR